MKEGTEDTMLCCLIIKRRADSAILTSDLTGKHIAPQGIHDILSCFYYFRNHILPVDRQTETG